MGKRGYFIPMLQLEHSDVPSEDSIRYLFFDWLFAQWREFFYRNDSLLSYSEKWFNDVLTIEVERDESNAGLTFWFNESVDWPSSIAEHWLKVSLAAGRTSLDIRLAKFGLALRMDEDDNFPTLASMFFRSLPNSPKAVRFIYDNQVWLIDNGKAYPELNVQGGERKRDEISLEDLPDNVRKTVDELITKNQCACPLCDGIEGTELGSSEISWVAKDFALKHIDSWSTINAFRWISGDTRFALCVGGSPYSGSIVYTTSDAGKHFRYANLPEKVMDAAIVKEDDVLVGLAISIAGGDSIWSKTYDGGKTWIKQELKDKPTGKIEKLVANGSRLITWSNDSSGASLFISHDSTKSFSRIKLQAAQIDRFVFSPFDEKTLYAIVRSSIDDKHANVAISNDGGVTFRLLSQLPFRPEQILIGSNPLILSVAGTEYDDDNSAVNAYVAHSNNGGSTFTITHKGGYQLSGAVTHPDGRLLIGTSEGGIFLSKDEGLSWSRVTDKSITSMAVDSFYEGDIIFFCYNQMFRLKTKS